METKGEWRRLLIGIVGTVLGLYSYMFFCNRIVMQPFRAICVIVLYWLMAVAPLLIIFLNGEKLKDYILSDEKIVLQIVTGIVLAVGMSLLLTLVPHFLGFGEYVDNGRRYTKIWQFVYEGLYCLLGVAAVEELVFRGFIYEKIKRISGKEIIAVVGSSVLFGAFHFMSANIVQMIMTTLTGLFFCFCRLKIKNCSLLSLIIAHGIYDAMISVWASLLIT